VTAGIISGAANLVGQGINYAATSSINQATQTWNEKMYGQQRMDALADWMRQNEYNSPAAQMRRLKEAGLNPHLVYGGGANSVSQPIRSTDAKSWNPQVPQVDLGSVARQGLYTAYDLQMKDAQKDQLAENTRLLKDKQLETQAKAAGILATTARTNQQYKQSDQLFGYVLEQAKLNNSNTRAMIDGTLTKNEQLKALFQPTVQKAVEEVLKLRLDNAKIPSEKRLIEQQIINLKSDNEIKKLDQQIKQYEINLNKNGVQKNDNIILRQVAGYVNELNSLWKKKNVTDNMYQGEKGEIKFKNPIKFY
jgi:hypothetical protein